MTSNLRKAHKLIWIILILTIPVVLVFAVLEIKEPAIDDSDLVLAEAPVGQMVLDDETFSMSVQKAGESSQLHIILKRPMKSPSAVIYGVSSEAKKEYFLGVIDKKGMYNFELSDGTKGIRIHDAIKEEDIINIEL
jgi:hypothetical protein